jgi:hypothetical protein
LAASPRAIDMSSWVERHTARYASLVSAKMASPAGAAETSPYRAVDANWQLIGHVRLCAPFTLGWRSPDEYEAAYHAGHLTHPGRLPSTLNP